MEKVASLLPLTRVWKEWLIRKDTQVLERYILDLLATLDDQIE